MSEKGALRLDWCSHDAAKYAVEHWHYSRSMPAGKTVKVGVWEDSRFIGAVVFSLGSNRHLGREFGLGPFECCELTRVALAGHRTPVSRILRIALSMLRKQSPGVKAVVSYADCDQDHVGAIYAAAGWIYVGMVQLNGGTPKFRVRGVVMHGRSIHSRWGKGAQRIEWLRSHIDPNAEKIFTRGKFKYVWPFDEEVRKRILPMSQPYPKRVRSAESGTAAPTAGGGANPTRTLSDCSAASLSKIRDQHAQQDSGDDPPRDISERSADSHTDCGTDPGPDAITGASRHETSIRRWGVS